MNISLLKLCIHVELQRYAWYKRWCVRKITSICEIKQRIDSLMKQHNNISISEKKRLRSLTVEILTLKLKHVKLTAHDRINLK